MVAVKSRGIKGNPSVSNNNVNSRTFMKPAKILSYCALIAIVTAITTGCSTQQTWSYHPNSYPAAAASTGKKVAVLPFEDDRANKNDNMAMIALLPVLPYGWEDLSTPEGVNQHINSGLWVNFKPTEDFPKAVADDLRNTGLFSDAYFSYQREGSDYAVEGKILSTQYDGKMITYCLGCYGVYLWMVGFPAGVTENDLSVELSLVNSSSNEKVFSKTYTATPRKQTSWIYYMKSDFNYAEMMAEVNSNFCRDIQPIVLNTAKDSASRTGNDGAPIKLP